MKTNSLNYPKMASVIQFCTSHQHENPPTLDKTVSHYKLMVTVCVAGYNTGNQHTAVIFLFITYKTKYSMLLCKYLKCKSEYLACTIAFHILVFLPHPSYQEYFFNVTVATTNRLTLKLFFLSNFYVI